MTPTQCGDARRLLGLTSQQLADMADLSDSTVEDFEAGRPVAECLADALQVALEAAGAAFSNSDGIACVRMRDKEAQ